MPFLPALAADFVSNATTATNEDVTGMAIPLPANALYWFKFRVCVSVAATTTGVELAVDIPTGATVDGITSHMMTSTTAAGFGTGTDDSGTVFADTAVAAGTYGWIEGQVQNGSTAGAIQLRVDTDAAAAVTVMKGTQAEYRDLAV